jgi:hypothetical protein
MKRQKEEVVEKRKRILREKHLDTITAMINLASTLESQEKMDEAASLEKEVVEKIGRILGE